MARVSEAVQPYDRCGVCVFSGDSQGIDAGRHARGARLRGQLEACLEECASSKMRLPVESVENGDYGDGEEREEEKKGAVEAKPCQNREAAGVCAF